MQSETIRSLFAAVVAASLLAAPARAAVLFEEDFESLTLGPIVTFGDSDDGGELPSREAWTNAGPAGWVSDASGVPGDFVNDGVQEFRGWTFVDREWWIGTAGGQNRQGFEFGYGTVAVADNDEFDDFSISTGEGQGPSPDGCTAGADCYEAALTTPAISLAGVGENEARIVFDSSWRPEDQQDASLEVSFDGGDFQTVFTWNSVNADGSEPVLGPGSPTGQGQFTKVSGPDGTQIGDLLDDNTQVGEVVDVALSNPAGAATMQVRWNMLEAGNDWWWAIDNVQVYTGTPGPRDPALKVVVDQTTGNVKIVNGTKDSVEVRGYQLLSGDGNFSPGSADFLSDADSDWVRLTEQGSGGDLSEGHLSSVTLPSGAELDLGEAWDEDYYVGEGEVIGGDVGFEYLIDGEEQSVRGLVEYQGSPAIFLDLNFDGSVDIDDWVEFLAITDDADLTDRTLAQAYREGDLDRDRRITIADFTTFRRGFEDLNGSGSFALALASLTVPEPTGCVLTITVVAMAASARRSLSRR